MADLSKITVLGAGLMGHGIALTFARAGHSVRVYDPFGESLATLHERVRASLEVLGCVADEAGAALARITAVADLAESVGDAEVVFEAAPEKPELKRQLFKDVELAAPKSCLFASNTSVIPITTIMQDLEDKTRAVGTHWWNPPHMIPLVEVIRTEWTSEEAFQAIYELLAAVGKIPVKVEKDVPGFIGNRLQHAMWREAVNLVEKGICTAEAVDTVVKSSFGRRLAVLGPLENADLVGTDLTLDIHENVLFDLDDRGEPSPYLRKLVENGKQGMKSGEGFRHWKPEEADQIRRRVAVHLRRLDTIIDD